MLRKILIIISLLLIGAISASAVLATPGNNNDNQNHKIEICHQTGNGGYNIVDVDLNAWEEHTSAHSDHENDVPAQDGLCPDDEGYDDGDEGDDDDLGIICEPPAYLNEAGTACITDDDPGDEPGDDDPGDDDEGLLCPWDGSIPIDSDECQEPGDDDPGDDNPGDEPGDDTPDVIIGDPVIYIPGPDLEEVTVWSNLPATGVAWIIQDSYGTWHQIVHPDGSLVITVLEYRDRFNRSEGYYESNHPMSRLVLGIDGDTNPDHYRAYDPLTGMMVGVWIEFNDEHAQAEDFGSGVAFGSSVNLITGERWDDGVQTR